VYFDQCIKGGNSRFYLSKELNFILLCDCFTFLNNSYCMFVIV
jgi:hypothetical protein